MNFNNCTIKTQEIIQQAHQIAQELGHNQLENEHIFKAITIIDQNVLPFLLKKLNVSVGKIIQIVDKELESFVKVSGAQLSLSRESLKTMNETAKKTKKMDDEYISIEHLIVAIFRSKSCISRVMKDQGVNEKELMKAIHELRKGQRVSSQNAEETYNSLQKYANNLNKLAKEGKLDQ